jgi:hypothetical protein
MEMVDKGSPPVKLFSGTDTPVCGPTSAHVDRSEATLGQTQSPSSAGRVAFDLNVAPGSLARQPSILILILPMERHF